jgi:rhamnosyltransferase subunit B
MERSVVSRIILTAIGSRGDLYPQLAIAIELHHRGHSVAIASHREYGPKVEALGLKFHPIAPENSAISSPEDLAKAMDLKTGTEYLIRHWVLAALPETYRQLSIICKDADLIVAGGLVYAASLVAEKQGIPWVSTLLQPVGFFSAYDPSVMPTFPILANLSALGPAFNKAVTNLLKLVVKSWATPIYKLRQDLELPPPNDSPLLGGTHSPFLVLAMFSSLLAKPQRDWPNATIQSGFAFYDESQAGLKLSPELEQFLAAGDAPIVFTLGTAAVLTPGNFYPDSIQGAKLLHRRAVLLIGDNKPPDGLTDDIITVNYAPYSLIFPQACAIVHQGGIGTTAQALRAGIPTIITPYSHDQPDNAARAGRLGTSRSIPRDRYSAEHVAAELRILFNDPIYSQNAAQIGQAIRREDGATLACDAIEIALNN